MIVLLSINLLSLSVFLLTKLCRRMVKDELLIWLRQPYYLSVTLDKHERM